MEIIDLPAHALSDAHQGQPGEGDRDRNHG
jgi:hypothetical protein